jgi:hypothetical protein
LVSVAAGASLEAVANELHLSEGRARSRLWAAVGRVWRKRAPPRRKPRTLAEVPAAVLLLEAPELADRRDELFAALPPACDEDVVAAYLGGEA